jgi:two-component system sensor kinase FixL
MVRVSFIRMEPVAPVMVDPLQIQQVFINLFRNSIEAMESTADMRREITIKVRPMEEQVQVRIQDTGPGFAPDIQGDQILPFTSTKIDGLGIGLSLSKSIIEKHGGRFWVDTHTTGAPVSFTLPVAARPA